MPDLTERAFEDAIVAALAGGDRKRRIAETPGTYSPPGRGDYEQRDRTHYDPELCLDPAIAVEFVMETQPKEWEKLVKQYGAKGARERFLARLQKQVEDRGTLDVLRNGVRLSGTHLRLAYFRPASGLNPELQGKYARNRFSVIRQLSYDGANELDLALFLNGLPLFTAELKNPITGQDVRDAVKQYREDRDSRHSLFRFGRCLAHFAVDSNLVQVTTQLQDGATSFLPFNLGHHMGAGNPPRATGYATAYLWEEIWAPDSVLNLVERFIHVVEEEDQQGKKSRRVIFPRYHQLQAVRGLVADARAQGPGRRYLIEHSAGSGKSITIAWLAHQLSTLHDDADRRVFDSIIVLTDRRLLDKQLRETVKQFQQTFGVVEAIEGTSQDLRVAVEAGRTIITSTIQKFPIISNEIERQSGKRFAVIIDEAHSSQSGEQAKAVHEALSGGSEEEALAKAEAEERAEVDPEDEVERHARLRRQPDNLSTFAFTATPKPRTLELFGARQQDGSYRPFSLYSMRQAIEEQFILDVLQHYSTYQTYWRLRKTIEDDPRFPKAKAASLLRKHVDEHPHTIASKVAIIVPQFVQNGMHKIGKRGKAMIVTQSRLHAVRYRQAVDRFIAENEIPFQALVAFSGTVRDGGIEYTESGMNGFPESQTRKLFESDDYRFLIVAEKFQTGFDQPLLHSMYVDKKLGGVKAVQTLSRLNRNHANKEDTMVVDFANEADEIQEAFQPYYQETILTEGTDPEQLYDRRQELLDAGVFDEGDVDRFAEVYFGASPTLARIHALLDTPATRFRELGEDAQDAFRAALRGYVRLYAFVAQVAEFSDSDLERLYAFGRHLASKLPSASSELPYEVRRDIDLDRQRIERTFEGAISLPHEQGKLQPVGGSGTGQRDEDVEALSEIIKALNERFGTEFSDADKVVVEQLSRRIDANEALRRSVEQDDAADARLTFNNVAQENFEQLIDEHYSFYKSVTDDPQLKDRFFDLLFEAFKRRAAS